LAIGTHFILVLDSMPAFICSPRLYYALTPHCHYISMNMALAYRFWVCATRISSSCLKKTGSPVPLTHACPSSYPLYYTTLFLLLYIPSLILYSSFSYLLYSLGMGLLHMCMVILSYDSNLCVPLCGVVCGRAYLPAAALWIYSILSIVPTLSYPSCLLYLSYSDLLFWILTPPTSPVTSWLPCTSSGWVSMYISLC